MEHLKSTAIVPCHQEPVETVTREIAACMVRISRSVLALFFLYFMVAS